jgi:hypothetical protein
MPKHQVEKKEKEVGAKEERCFENMLHKQKKFIRVLQDKCIFTKSNQMLKEEMTQCNTCRTTKII